MLSPTTMAMYAIAGEALKALGFGLEPSNPLYAIGEGPRPLLPECNERCMTANAGVLDLIIREVLTSRCLSPSASRFMSSHEVLRWR